MESCRECNWGAAVKTGSRWRVAGECNWGAAVQEAAGGDKLCSGGSSEWQQLQVGVQLGSCNAGGTRGQRVQEAAEEAV